MNMRSTSNQPLVGAASSEPEAGPEHGYGEQEDDLLEHDPSARPDDRPPPPPLLMNSNWPHLSLCGGLVNRGHMDNIFRSLWS